MNKNNADFALFGLYASVLPVVRFLTSEPSGDNKRAELESLLYDNLRKIRKDNFPQVIKRTRWSDEVAGMFCFRHASVQIESMTPSPERNSLMRDLAKVSVSMPDAFSITRRHLFMAYEPLAALDLSSLKETVKCLTEALDDIRYRFFHGNPKSEQLNSQPS